MKTMLLSALLGLSLLIVSCKKEDERKSEVLALISFTGDKPRFYPTEQTIKFTPQAQFSGGGRPVQIEYVLLDGNNIVASGTADASINMDGMALFYTSNQQSVTIDPVAYKGKTLTVFLDPQHKVTLPEYRVEAQLHWKKGNVAIP